MVIRIVKKNIIKAFLGTIILALAFVSAFQSLKTTEVFTPQKELPIYYVDSESKKAAITFDNAWGADDIPDILNTLKKENVKATFFVIGQWAEKYPQTVRMISEDGHEIANHSYSHLRMSRLDREKIAIEIKKCSDVITSITGKKVNLFRPPYGDYNNMVINTTNELGYYPIQWNVDSLDWKPGISLSEILYRVNSKIVPGSIILFHNDTKYTAKVLPQIITDLKSKGYEFCTVSDLLIKENYRIDHDGKQIKEK